MSAAARLQRKNTAATKTTITVALAGNPNSGKTTIFNNLTGALQHVGNYPGVTVEKKEGWCRHDGIEIKVVDLPGTYSLTAHSIEEIVARDFVIHRKPDVVVDILDASNLERNLYLATQLIELGVPLVLALNMSDVAEVRGVAIDTEKLSELLGAPAVPTVGHKRKGMEALLAAIMEVAGRGRKDDGRTHVDYGGELEEEVARIQSVIEREAPDAPDFNARWLAVKLLEEDADIRKKVVSSDVLAAVEKSARHIETIFGDRPPTIVAEHRYGFINGVCREAVRSTMETRLTLSDRIDSVMTHRALGLPIFLGLMFLLFQLTFTIGDPLMSGIERAFGWLAGTVGSWWPQGSQSALRSLLVDGIIGGVGGVLVFLPNIMLLFLAIAFLEDSGYMPRAAFVMDRFMHKIGLHGKSFVPMLIGFGCTVPAIMATRTLDNRRDRLTTMMILPLVSCGARLPIYALIIPAFFPHAWQAPMLWIIYVIGISLAVLAAKLLRSTVLKGQSVPLVMELPPYRIPTVRSVLIHMWNRTREYVKKAGTVILGVAILMWFMTSYPKKTQFEQDYDGQVVQAQRLRQAKESALKSDLGIGAEAAFPQEFLTVAADVEGARAIYEEALAERDAEDSSAQLVLESAHESRLAKMKADHPEMYVASVRYLDEIKAPFEGTLEEIENARAGEVLAYTAAGRMGRGLECVLSPLGFDWKIGTALVGAFAAKEVFVAQLGIVYSVGAGDERSEALRAQLQKNYTPLTAFCIMLFCLVSAPCVATIATTRMESGSLRWALLQLGGLTVLAYVITLVAYQAGRLVGLG